MKTIISFSFALVVPALLIAGESTGGRGDESGAHRSSKGTRFMTDDRVHSNDSLGSHRDESAAHR